MPIFERSCPLPVPVEAAWAWHARPGALERLLPPWERIEIVDRSGDFETGSVVLRIPIGPFRVTWVAQHRLGEGRFEWIDSLVTGPFPRWMHVHRLTPDTPTTSRLTDRIEYALPLGPIGQLAAPRVERRLTRMFAYRHALLPQDLALHAAWADRPRLAIAITGASGLIGRALVPLLTTGGHRVVHVVRKRLAKHDVLWDPAEGTIEAERLEGVDAVVHLAGEPITGRWTGEKKRRILESRRRGTALLAGALARLRRPPRVLVSASAIGIYGDRGDEPLTESSPLPAGVAAPFVSQVAQAWEEATTPAEQAGIRVVRLRIGLVLTPAGGALGAMLPAFRLGLGGRLGRGTQYQSWIALDDVIGAIYHALFQETLRGAVNATAPEPVTQAEFAQTLARVLGRPAPLAMPAAPLRVLLGEMADELLLASTRVLSSRLEESGYRFRFRQLEPALRYLLGAR
jgi:hypothetical protein